MTNRAILAISSVLLLALVGCGGGGDSSSSTGAATGADSTTNSESQATLAADRKAVGKTFTAFLKNVHDGDGEGACALFTRAGRKAWEAVQAEPTVIEGHVVEKPTKEEAACENSVLETIFAKFPFDLKKVTVQGKVAEGTIYTASKQGVVPAGTAQGTALFAKSDGEWKIVVIDLGEAGS